MTWFSSSGRNFCKNFGLHPDKSQFGRRMQCFSSRTTKLEQVSCHIFIIGLLVVSHCIALFKRTSVSRFYCSRVSHHSCWHGKCHISILVYAFCNPVLLDYHIAMHWYIQLFGELYVFQSRNLYFCRLNISLKWMRPSTKDNSSVKTVKRCSRGKQLREITMQGCITMSSDILALSARKDFTTRVEWGSTWLCTTKQYKTGQSCPNYMNFLLILRP